jgi:Protein of unknown function (DUF3263)
VAHEDASAPAAATGESAPELPTQRAPETVAQEALFEVPGQPGPAGAAGEVSEKPDTPPVPASSLGARERAVLDFERRRWKHAGAKEEAIRDELGLSPTAYFQILNALLDDPAALAYNPTLVGGLRRRREARQRSRR